MAAIAAHREFLHTILDNQAERRKRIDGVFPPQPHVTGYGATHSAVAGRSKSNVLNYIPGEESVRNDTSEWYGLSGEWGANHILGCADDEVCSEYPALRRLMDLKTEITASCAHAPLHVQIPSTPEGLLAALSPARFDVILLNPLSFSPASASWAHISSLPIRQLCADPGFVFLWVGPGDADGLERGRECFVKWGFRRAEDIVWVKTNKRGAGGGYGEGLFASQKVHCLMGIRGTVRRSTDSRFVHCNVDTDVMVWEAERDESSERSEPELELGLSDHTEAMDPTDRDAPVDSTTSKDSAKKPPAYPPYLYTLIENFCLGTRRLELFGDPTQCRRGWVTASLDPLPPSPDSSSAESVGTFDPTTYTQQVYTDTETGRPMLPFHPEIDTLRPQSPKRRPRQLPGQVQGQVQQPRALQPNGAQGYRPPRAQAGMDMGVGMGMSMPNPVGMGMGMGYGINMPPSMGGMGMMPSPLMLQQMQMAQMAQMQAQAQAQAQQMAQMQFARMHMAQMMGSPSGQEQFVSQQQRANLGIGPQQQQQEYGQGQQGWYGPNGWTQQ